MFKGVISKLRVRLLEYLLSPSARQELVLKSEEYRELLTENAKKEREKNRLALEAEEELGRYHAEQARLILESATREQLLKKSDAKVVELERDKIELEQSLAQSRSDLEQRVLEVKSEPTYRLGEHILSDSSLGVLVVNRDNIIIDANDAVCKYLQIEKPELIGDVLGKMKSVVPYFNIYSSFFEQVAKAAAVEGVEIKPNRFEINSVPFDIMGYSSRNGNPESPSYNGGFLVLTPLKERGFLERVFSSNNVTVAPEEPVTRESITELYLQLMGVHAKHRYIDLSNSSMSREAMESLTKFYKCVRRTPDSDDEYTLTFRNVSESERDKLIELGVDAKHIRGIRKKETPSGEIISQAEGAGAD